ncbi:hypothetical protein TVAG_303570 [Trichomonas vaginalis G3]|uniref:Exportin-1 C-terminal domain-containing protein n=1 Tax=Trichomonas vaginalis (strain ATCC PRA-98 / G3) TaxID=412133 RepID=A2DR39_TRIV3|nr:nuclear export signal receptor protein [Trichomonas vaginalis G3]EAY17138.1 hypothetical protein TVAG_303570 [Trichomonas vaginalis G3]KAI5508854.1 nuclear export signal receptor protein [Trichomonas vaginalis G3]|eukprot:XP_001329361.1 hypothetical protein [Trichomonas vaginalis G3]
MTTAEELVYLESKIADYFKASQVDEELMEISQDPERLETFKSFFELPEQKIQLAEFASLAIKNIITVICPKWNSNENHGIISWMISKISTYPVSHFIIGQFSHAVAIILTTALASYNDKISQIVEEISTLLDQSPIQIYSALLIFSNIYTEIDLNNPRCRSHFVLNFSNKFFMIALEQSLRYEAYKEIDTENAALILDAAIKVCRYTLRTPQTKTVSSARQVKVETIALPQIMSEIVSNPENLSKLFSICNVLLAEGTKPNMIASAFSTIEAYVSVAENNFRQQLQTIVGTLLDMIGVYITEDWGSNIDLVECISKILFAASSKFTPQVSMELGNFAEFITKFSEATVSMLSTIKFNYYEFPKIESSLSFCAKLFNTIATTCRNAEFKQNVAAQIAPICHQYLEFLCSSEIQQYPVSIIANITQPVQMMIRSDPAGICSHIRNLMQHLEEIINSRGTITDRSIVENAQKKLGIMISVVARTMINQYPVPNDLSEANYHVYLFSHTMRLINDSINWLNEGERFVEFEQSVVNFITIILGTIVISDKGRDHTLFYQACNDLQSPVSSKNVAADLLSERLFCTLSCFGGDDSHDSLINDAVFAMNILAHSHEGLVKFVNNANENNFIFQQRMKRQRYIFYQQLLAILIETRKFDGISELLNIILSRVPQNQRISDTEARGLAIDIRGLFNAAKTAEFYDILFDWFYNNFLNFFVALANSYINDPSVIMQILKMFSIIVQQPNLSTKRICFPPFSPKGNILFEKCVEIINPVLILSNDLMNSERESTEKKDTDTAIKLVSYCARVFYRMIEGGYVCIDAFKVYGLTTFTDTLSLFFGIFSDEDFMMYFLHFTKYLNDISQLFNQICQKQMPVLADCPDWIVIVVNFAINMLMDEVATENRDKCYDILKSVARYIVDEFYIGNEPSDNLKTISQRSTMALWNLLFSGPGKLKADQRLYVADPLKLFLVLFPELVDEALNSILNQLPEDRKQSFMIVIENFKADLEKDLDDEKGNFSGKIQKITDFVQTVGLKIVVFKLDE